MNGFNGTLEEFWAERRRLCRKYKTTVIVTGCYLSNWGSDYMCDKCARRYVCEKIAKGDK